MIGAPLLAGGHGLDEDKPLRSLKNGRPASPMRDLERMF